MSVSAAEPEGVLHHRTIFTVQARECHLSEAVQHPSVLGIGQAVYLHSALDDICGVDGPPVCHTSQAACYHEAANSQIFGALQPLGSTGTACVRCCAIITSFVAASALLCPCKPSDLLQCAAQSGLCTHQSKAEIVLQAPALPLLSFLGAHRSQTWWRCQPLPG